MPKTEDSSVHLTEAELEENAEFVLGSLENETIPQKLDTCAAWLRHNESRSESVSDPEELRTFRKISVLRTVRWILRAEVAEIGKKLQKLGYSGDV